MIMTKTGKRKAVAAGYQADANVSVWRRIKRNWGLYLLLAPAVILLICFTYIPMYGVLIAFKDYRPVDGIWASQWVGFDYFVKFFKSYQFGTTIANTLVISIYSLIATFPIPIIMALLINQIQSKKFKKTFQTISYLPHFISTVVMVGMLLILLSPSSGLLGGIGKALGIEIPNIMGNAKAFSSIYTWSEVWQHSGWDSIIYIAALSAVDPSLYEAATVDGASRFQKLRFIDLPMLMPTAVILLIMRAGSIMSVGFEKVYLMQNELNLTHSEIISTYVYKIGIISAQYSYSAAINLFNTVVNLILLVSVNQISKKLSDSSLW